MKIRALGVMSGASGERVKGDEFVVDKAYGQGLIARGYAEEVVEVAAVAPKSSESAKPEQAKG